MKKSKKIFKLLTASAVIVSVGTASLSVISCGQKYSFDDFKKAADKEVALNIAKALKVKDWKTDGSQHFKKKLDSTESSSVTYKLTNETINKTVLARATYVKNKEYKVDDWEILKVNDFANFKTEAESHSFLETWLTFTQAKINGHSLPNMNINFDSDGFTLGALIPSKLASSFSDNGKDTITMHLVLDSIVFLVQFAPVQFSIDLTLTWKGSGEYDPYQWAINYTYDTWKANVNYTYSGKDSDLLRSWVLKDGGLDDKNIKDYTWGKIVTDDKAKTMSFTFTAKSDGTPESHTATFTNSKDKTKNNIYGGRGLHKEWNSTT